MGAERQISLVLNGDERTVADGTGLVALVESLGLPVRGVLVERNGTALLRDEWPDIRLTQGDRLEILRVVAGG